MYTKIISSKRKIADIKSYLVNDKSDPTQTRNVKETTLLCGSNWSEEMESNAKIFNANDGVKYHQIILSADPSQVPPPNIEIVHEVGVEIAKIFSDKGFQVAIETHNDTAQIHDHIIIGAVNVFDGHKLQISKAKSAQRAKKADFRFVEITDRVDEICKKYGLLTLTESKERKTQQQKKIGEQPTNQLNIYVKDSYQRSMQAVLSDMWKKQNIFNQEDFTKALAEVGIRISRVTRKGKITYQDIKGHKVRADRLGAFNQDDIINLIDINKELEEERKEKERREKEERERQEQAAKAAAAAKAKEEFELQKRLAQAQQAARARKATEEKEKVEKAKAIEKSKLIKALNNVMSSGFTTMPEWKELRKKLEIHISNDSEGNLIYRFANGNVSISSKDYPDYSKQSVISKAADNKIAAQEKKKKENTKTKTISNSKNKGRSR